MFKKSKKDVWRKTTKGQDLPEEEYPKFQECQYHYFQQDLKLQATRSDASEGMSKFMN